MNISNHVKRAAKWFPHHCAVIFDGLELSYLDLDSQANRLANALRAHGVSSGDCVALYLPNAPCFIICYLAIQKLGAIAVSINVIFKLEEVKYILNDSRANVVFTVSDLIPNVPLLDCPDLRTMVICEGDSYGHVTLDEWLSKGSAEFKTHEMDGHEPSALLYTSGTTGTPKGAILSHGNVISNMYTTMHHVGFHQTDRVAAFLPLSCLRPELRDEWHFWCLRNLILHHRFVPDQVLASVQHNHISMFFAVPTIFIGLLNLDLSQYNLSSIRYEFSAAATLPQEISRHWKERFNRPIYEGYGLTECAPFACYNHDFRHVLGSIGTACENFELKVIGSDDSDLPTGHWGEICIRGPGVMQGYWGKPEDTAWALRGGWLHSGDIGYMNDEGYLYLVDRVKDMVNVSGFKVWPAEVEQLLYGHPAVKEVAVYGLSHPLKGEQVAAAIILREHQHATSQDIINYCCSRLAVYKAPEVVRFVNELPKSATGKILKRLLKSQGTT